MEAYRFDHINSATKYPSIPTYHALGDKGRLLPDRNVEFSGLDGLVFTEKIDGTNARLILDGAGDFLIGSREELLYAKGDRLTPHASEIVSQILPVAERLAQGDWVPGLTTFYFEVFGHKVGAHGKDYTRQGRVGHRLFDVSWANENVIHMYRSEIAAWRDAGGQSFKDESWLRLTGLMLTPRVEADGPPPTGLEETRDWLDRNFPITLASLDDDLGSRPEGCVVRSTDRRKIVKIRFEDYRRTLR